jgi:hypothetical protein
LGKRYGAIYRGNGQMKLGFKKRVNFKYFSIDRKMGHLGQSLKIKKNRFTILNNKYYRNTLNYNSYLLEQINSKKYYRKNLHKKYVSVHPKGFIFYGIINTLIINNI